MKCENVGLKMTDQVAWHENDGPFLSRYLVRHFQVLHFRVVHSQRPALRHHTTYTVIKKLRQICFCNNFVNSTPTFVILSLL